MTISKDIIIGNLLKEKPEAAEILMRNGMGCLGCPSAQVESLEDAANVHGMDINKLLSELNA